MIMISVHLSKDLRVQYKRRSMQIRKGDEVKVIRGKYAGKVGTVANVDNKNSAILISGITIKKTIGTEKQAPIKPSNVVITNLDLKDNARQRILLRKVKEVKIEKPKQVETKPAEPLKEEKKQEAEKKKEEKHETEKRAGAKILESSKKGKEMGSGAKSRPAQKV